MPTLEEEINGLKNDIFKFKVYIAAIIFIAAIFGITQANIWMKIKEVDPKVQTYIDLIDKEKNDAITQIKNENRTEIAKAKNELQEAKKEAIISLDKLNVPIGTILPFAGPKDKIPSSWMLCDGRKLNHSDFKELFNIIGLSWGGENGIFLNLPNLQGYFLRGVDNGTKNDPDANNRIASNNGGNSKDNVGSIQHDSFQGHWHQYRLKDNSGGNSSYNWMTDGSSGSDKGGAIRKAIPDGENGSPRISAETRPKNAYVNFIIRVK